MDVWLQDGKILKVESSNVQSGDQLCVKAYAYKDYVLREDRIKTPMRRVGERGSGRWESISWEEAYIEIAGKLYSGAVTLSVSCPGFSSGFPSIH